MKAELLEFSIVVAANDHNPTILNPDFLALHSIVSKDWGWKIAGLPIITPPFATVPYDSGVTVTVETNKFQAIDKSAKDGPQSSKIKEIALKHVQVLPHVRYTAVGINFRSFAEHAEADTFLRKHFLKLGPWNNKDHNLQGVSLKFAYPLKEGRLFLSLESATIKHVSNGQSEEKHGILVYANFHRGCIGYPCDQQVVKHLGNTEKDWQYFQRILPDVLGIINDVS